MRSGAQLVADQLSGLLGYFHERRTASLPSTGEPSREVRRGHEARLREHEALMEWSRRQLEDGIAFDAGPVTPRAVIAHRSDWFRGKIAEGLARQGIRVVAEVEDPAHACGVAIAEQPDIVVVEGNHPKMAGLDALTRITTLAGHAVIGVQTRDGESVEQYLDAGAAAVFTRRVPPAYVVNDLTRCLTGSASC